MQGLGMGLGTIVKKNLHKNPTQKNKKKEKTLKDAINYVNYVLFE